MSEKYAVVIEETGDINVLLVIAEKNNVRWVEDIFSADDENLDSLWDLVFDRYPIQYVLEDGKFVEPGELTVREAAEATEATELAFYATNRCEVD